MPSGRLVGVNRALALLVSGALFMEMLDGTIVATAAPSIGRSLGVESVDIGITITSYLLTVAVLIPLSGWLSDRVGARRVFICAIAVFTIASALCASSTSLLELTLFRVAQGIGGAMMVPVGSLVVMRSTAKDDLITAVAFLTWPALFALILGPVLGGIVTTYASWRWIFLINVPIGVIGLALAPRLVPNLRAPARRGLDWIGLATSTTGLAALVYGVSLVDEHRIPVGRVVVLLLAAALLLGIAVWHLRRTAHPLVDLGSLRVETFRVAQLGGSLYRIAILAVPFLLPLMFQDAFGWSAARSGTVLIFVFIGNLGIKPATTPLLRRYGFRPVLIGAIIVGLLATAACGWLRSGTPLVLLALLLLVSGIFRSIGMSAYNTIAFADIDAAEMSHANTLSSTGQQLAAGFAVAAGSLALRLGESLRSPLGQTNSPTFAYTLAFATLALLLVPALVEAWRLAPSVGATIGGGTGRRRTTMRNAA